MNLQFTNLVYKLIEFDKQIKIHNSNIDILKNDYLSREKDFLSDENKVMASTMKNLGLSYSNNISSFTNYRNSKERFFKHMVETDGLLKQVKVLIKVFLDYDLVIDNVDVSKPLPFDLEQILNQVSIYPKRLTLLLKRGVIDEDFYNSLYNDNWLNQSVQGCKGLFISLVKQYDAFSRCYFAMDKNKDVAVISERLYISDVLPTMNKLAKIMEYLFCPKIDQEFPIDHFVEQYEFFTDESISLRCNELNKII